jgi:hypothetical protein
VQSLQKKLNIHFSELIEPLKTPLVLFNFFALLIEGEKLLYIPTGTPQANVAGRKQVKGINVLPQT